MKPGKKIKANNQARTENTNPFNLTENQQRCSISQLKCVGLSFANSTLRIIAFYSFAEIDIDSLVRNICRTYAGIIGRSNFKYLLFFNALL